MKSQIDELFRKEMSRKEFVQHIGSALLIMFGISGLLKALVPQATKVGQTSSMGYGSSSYGGVKR